MEGNAENLDDHRDDQSTDRQRSSIKFPYTDLSEAIAVAEAIHNHAGTQCDRAQLAGFLQQSVSSGAFRLKVATASNFGLVKSSQGTVRLTSLGRDIVDSTKSDQAKVRAFFTIPLYQAIYEEFKGRPLPPARALERHMQSMGVPSKQTDKARQAFQRSAEEAGFFRHGRDRLVEPAFRDNDGESSHHGPSEPDPSMEEQHAHNENRQPNNGGGGNGSLPPLLQGLIEALPAPSTEWSSQDRVNWLNLAVHIFSVTYTKSDQDSIEITLIEAKQHDGSF